MLFPAHLKRLQPYKVRANTDAIPNRWERGTLNHEGIAGISACVEYLEELGRHADAGVSSRRNALRAAYKAIQTHERVLSERMLRGLAQIPKLKLYGIADPKRVAERCPTFAMRVEAPKPAE